MPTDNEIQRVAAAANALRPEWPIRSLITILSTKYAHRPYRDLAVALAWIAADPSTKTPARLAEAGPWWQATSMTEGTMPVQAPRCADHPTEKAYHCRHCIAAAVLKPATFVAPKPANASRDRNEWIPSHPPRRETGEKTDATLSETRSEPVPK